jgi:hypothetical protein
LNVTFVWDTSGVVPGNYTLSAFADPVFGEEDVSDNYFVDGDVSVLPLALHDVAVLDVTASPLVVMVGEDVSVRALVKNRGLMAESFNVSAFFDDSLISTVLVSSLSSGVELNVTFVWDTSGVTADPVKDEANTDDNTLVDGVVQISPAAAPTLIPRWLSNLLLIGLIPTILFLIILFFYRRRKKEKLREPFDRAWKAWYGKSSP